MSCFNEETDLRVYIVHGMGVAQCWSHIGTIVFCFQSRAGEQLNVDAGHDKRTSVTLLVMEPGRDGNKCFIMETGIEVFS